MDELGFARFDVKKLPRSRVELHLHFEGSFRIETIWELAKQKKIDLGFETIEDLRAAITVTSPETLAAFLGRFAIFMPVFVGDTEAIERAAYELCEDQAKQDAIYFETRYSAHGLSNLYGQNPVSMDDPGAVTPKMVVDSVNRGLRRGEKDFKIKARVILCCLLPFPEWNEEVLDLCVQYRNDGVVGIDIAGDEGHDNTPEDVKERCVYAVFKKAAELGIHRTVHAGEAGTSANVEIAINRMGTERLGHAYRVLQDMEVYQQVLDRNIHIETCPHSSVLTGSVPISITGKHPIVKFVEDGANFSINKDDPLVTGTTLNCEYRMLRNMGLQEAHFARANFNAARACFLPSSEKTELINYLCKVYGFETESEMKLSG